MILLTVMPSAPNTSTGSRILSLATCANPMEIDVAASPARNSLDSTSGPPATCRVRHSHLPTDRALPADLRPDTIFRDTTLPGGAVSSAFGPSSDILPTLFRCNGDPHFKDVGSLLSNLLGQHNSSTILLRPVQVRVFFRS